MTIDLITPQVQDYMQSFVPPRPPEMQNMEEYAQKTGFPIIGPAVGYLCYQMARLIGARKVFELGSGYGYSTAWFALAVRDNGGGRVYHVVWDADLSQRAREHLGAMGFEDIVQYQVGEAVQALRAADGTFDLIFNDIEKPGYPASLPVIQEKLRPGGVLIVDNMLWGGRIFDPGDQAASTQGVRQLAQQISQSNAWIASLLPIRDGLLVACKK